MSPVIWQQVDGKQCRLLRLHCPWKITMVLWLNIWWTSVKGRSYGNQLCSARWRKLTHPSSFCVLASTTVERIAKPIPIRRPPKYPPHFAKHYVNFSTINLWHVVVHLYGVGGCTHAKISYIYVMVVKSHLLGGSSIASL